MRKTVLPIIVFILVLIIPAGCATQSKKTATSETIEYSSDSNRRKTEPVVVKQRTMETSASKTAQEGGLLSETVEVAGDVLALPFRAVGGLIDFVF
jgi:hypothetical protein